MNTTLHHILHRHLSSDARDWLEAQVDTITDDFQPRKFYLAFGACARHLGNQVLNFSETDYSSLVAVYPNFVATDWTADELGRILLMTALPTDRNREVLDELFAATDYREAMALYRGLYFLENASEFTGRAREGLRTNMVGVFDAIALDNPYPARYLSQDAWNQMVLKAMFMQRPMYRIYRIEDRKNPKLADIFMDYAEERWSAHRPVSPELWRFVAGHVSDRSFPGLRKTIRNGSAMERAAAAKAILESDFVHARDWLGEQAIDTDDLPGWNEIGRASEGA
ncbi:EboA domain-containing protein [Lewinella sp. IMCC34191]|uniref:EboA domain-containing protein n=1 Tax=Lewinella sp. IMCC34191 TaxID=2259172 RepID=UPI000E2681DB|nr:EboA domain-containing protein [Lewinella sp. IMCC34191]